MTRIILDAETRTKLLDLKEHLELCDEAGNVLAIVSPTGRKVEVRDEVGNVVETIYRSPFSDEELDRRAEHLEGRTLAEIKERWKQL